MPAELLLLLIVAFASPSCQVLSSLRMGEALQPLPCPCRDPPKHASPSGPRTLASGFSCPQHQGIAAPSAFCPPSSSPRPSSPDPPALSNLRFRSLDPCRHPHPSLRAQESRTPASPLSGPRSPVPNPCVPSAAILDDQTVCGRGERLALALAREQINGIIEVPAKARVEVDIFELQRDSQYETTDTSEQGHGGRGVRRGRLVALSLSHSSWPPQLACFVSF